MAFDYILMSFHYNQCSDVQLLLIFFDLWVTSCVISLSTAQSKTERLVRETSIEIHISRPGARKGKIYSGCGNIAYIHGIRYVRRYFVKGTNCEVTTSKSRDLEFWRYYTFET